jgi:hypothetical protein
MPENYVVSALLASTIAAATPDGVPAASPVTVTGCDQYNMIIPLMDRGPNTQVRYGNLEISFVNRSPITARHVRFAVGGGADAQIVDAFGRFSTRIPIIRDFEPANDDNVSGPGNCAIELVEFSDGSSWRAP